MWCCIAQNFLDHNWFTFLYKETTVAISSPYLWLEKIQKKSSRPLKSPLLNLLINPGSISSGPADLSTLIHFKKPITVQTTRCKITGQNSLLTDTAWANEHFQYCFIFPASTACFLMRSSSILTPPPLDKTQASAIAQHASLVAYVKVLTLLHSKNGK